LAGQDKGCERLMTVPGIGPIISSAIVAAIGTGDAFSKGRDFGAWLGLVPKQISTGDRDNPRRRIKAWQSLSARTPRSGGLGRAGQGRAGAVGTLWPEPLT
jgi:transposase